MYVDFSDSKQKLKNKQSSKFFFQVDLLITHFSEAVIPPPLCSYKLHFDFAINNVLWSPHNLDLIVQLMNNEFIYFKYQAGKFFRIKQLNSTKILFVLRVDESLFS